MSIIRQMIKSSKLNRNEKRRWKERDTIPCEVLSALHETGIMLEPEPPKTGMGIMRFLELLWDFILSCPNNKTSAAALAIYENTVRFELMADWKKKVRPKKSRIIWPDKTDRKTRECFDRKI